MDGDWHAICQAIFQGVELHKAVKCQKSGEHKKVKALWASKEAKDNGIDCFHDLGSVQKIQTRPQATLDL